MRRKAGWFTAARGGAQAQQELAKLTEDMAARNRDLAEVNGKLQSARQELADAQSKLADVRQQLAAPPAPAPDQGSEPKAGQPEQTPARQ